MSQSAIRAKLRDEAATANRDFPRDTVEEGQKKISGKVITFEITPAYVFLARAYVELDQLDDANDAIKTVLKNNPQYTLKAAARRYPYRIDEEHNRFLDSLRKAGLPE